MLYIFYHNKKVIMSQEVKNVESYCLAKKMETIQLGSRQRFKKYNAQY